MGKSGNITVTKGVKVKPPSFKQDSKEFKKLLKLLKDGKIKKDEQPASARSRFSEIFGKFTPTQFRSQYNKAKGMVRVNDDNKAVAKAVLSDDSDDSDDDDIEETEEEEDTGYGAMTRDRSSGQLMYKHSDGFKTKCDPLMWTPKKVVGQYTNKDGIRCVAILVALTGGAAANTNGGVDIGITSDGCELTIVEDWSEYMQDMDAFYETFPKDTTESDDEFFRRKVAMVDRVRELQNGKSLKSTHTFRLPFRVEPSQKRVLFIGTTSGCRFCHIDLAERKKVEV